MQRLLKGLAFLLVGLIGGVRSSASAAVYRAPDLLHGKPLGTLHLLPDGQGVVGVAGGEIFRWRLNEERVVLGSIPSTMDGLIVNPVTFSGDGSALFGDFRPNRGRNPDSLWEPAPYAGFRWTADAGLTKFAMADHPRSAIAPISVSFDGSTFVGVLGYRDELSTPLVTRTTRWSNGLYEQIDLPNQSPYPDVVAESSFLLSGDGDVIVGGKYSNESLSGIFRWTADGGVQDWAPAGVSGELSVSAISHDGGVFVGTANFDGFGRRAFRWSAGSGMERLDALDLHSRGSRVTADGSAVLAFSYRRRSGPGGGEVRQPYLWNETDGSRRISEVLDDLGVAWRHLDWFNPDDVTHLSADGSALFGGTALLDPISGRTETIHWIVTLAVPEPTGAALTCVGAAIVAATRRRDCIQGAR